MTGRDEWQIWAVEVWNRRVPRGAIVEIVEDGGEVFTTKTRSEAWQLGCGTPVVSVEGKSGGFLLSRVLPRSTVA
jgi:hypothetical protein